MKTMICLSLIFAFEASSVAEAQWWDTFKKIFSSDNGLTEQDAAAGIKEALVKGTSDGVHAVSQIDGYFGNPEIKIPFPPDARMIESKLRAVGLGDQVDKVIVTMNRAAEDAARDARPIFVSAIQKMTITDAIAIVRGKNDAATSYLKHSTSGELNTKFQPVISASLDKVDATKYWTSIITAYNQLPFVEKINPSLPEYVTAKAIDGLFVMIAKEELAIRNDPVARTTDLLKKVFGK